MIKYYFDDMLLPTPQLSVTGLFADEVCRERKKFENRICYTFVGFGNNSRKTILDPWPWSIMGAQRCLYDCHLLIPVTICRQDKTFTIIIGPFLLI